ncbi:hypothetical protein A7982_12435 [Minicystis rosea]|nr:hypothetical protein A7982_12435 [Minicystis rosea]
MEDTALSAVVPLPESEDERTTPTPESGARNRRSADRIDVMWSVDCETEETFLYAAITNISAMGIFVRTTEPLPVGTRLMLRFAPPHAREPFALSGMVQWVNPLRPREDNPNPGMGIRFSSLTLADRERIVEAIRTIAYLREEPKEMDLAEGGN